MESLTNMPQLTQDIAGPRHWQFKISFSSNFETMAFSSNQWRYLITIISGVAKTFKRGGHELFKPSNEPGIFQSLNTIFFLLKGKVKTQNSPLNALPMTLKNSLEETCFALGLKISSIIA